MSLLIIFLSFCGLQPVAQTISFNNPGLEGAAGSAGAAPPGWTVCASSPDIQPNVFCVVTPPFEGASYAGFAQGEYIGQQLPNPIVKDVQYSFSVYLCHSADYASTQALGACPDKGIRGGAGTLKIWAGNSSCQTAELLWTSPSITPTTWTQYTVTFTARNNSYNFIMFQNDVASSNILLDKIDPIIKPTVTCMPPVKLSASAVPTACPGVNDGVVQAGAVTDGKAPFNYSIDGTTFQAGTSFPGLPPGTYKVFVKDAEGCKDSVMVTVVQGVQPTITGTVVNVSCPGKADGSITANTPSGGTAPFTYSLGTGPYGSSNTFTGLTAGTYVLNFKDSKGCTNSANLTVGTDPRPAINAGADQSVCTGSPVTLRGSGGVSYTWNMGVTDNVPFTPTATATYTVTGTNAKGCTNTDQVIVTLIAPPDAGTGRKDTICPNVPFQLSTLLTGSQPGGSWKKSTTFGGTLNTATGEFNPGTTMTPGTYVFWYIVKGTAPCPEDTAFVTVVLKQPTAMFNTIPSFCAGSTGYLKPVFTGTGPFTLDYVDCRGNAFTATNLRNGDSVGVSPAVSPCNYTITSVTEGGAYACTNTTTSSVTITLLSPPTIQLDSLVCN
ncbi:MAG: hypothetical protein V4616_11765, partial [Bacteroidota bacterium]